MSRSRKYWTPRPRREAAPEAKKEAQRWEAEELKRRISTYYYYISTRDLESLVRDYHLKLKAKMREGAVYDNSLVNELIQEVVRDEQRAQAEQDAVES